MANPVDENRVPTLRAALNTDGTTIVNVGADTTLRFLAVSNGSTGSNFGTKNAKRDQNHNPALMAVSNVDGVTPVPIYADSSGNLLVNST